MELPTNITSTNLADGDVAIRYLREQEAIRRARSKRRWIAAGIVLASLFALMIGCSVLVVGVAASTAASTPGQATSAPVSAAQPSAGTVSPPSPAADSAPSQIAPMAPAAPAPSTELPRTWIDEGMWHASDEIEAGTYRTTGRAVDETYKCMITVTGADGNVADYQSAETGPLRITVHDDQTVTVQGCAPLTKVG